MRNTVSTLGETGRTGVRFRSRSAIDLWHRRKSLRAGPRIGSGEAEPSGGLACDACAEVEILVVVQVGEPGYRGYGLYA